MAHYDADGLVAPHALRNAAALAELVDRLVIVSTAELDRASAAQLATFGELVERDNAGYDFFSWRVGLAGVEGLGSYDLVITCNDSYVGPLLPYARIVADMAREPVDFWGITRSDRRARHVQSYFVAHRRWVVNSPTFKTFWTSMTPESNRLQVIARYEIGLSQQLSGAGFRFGSFFNETERDRVVARRRHWHWAAHTVGERPRHKRREAAKRMFSEPWNPATALADRALDGGRLPIVKIDTLRYDPYRLGADRLLTLCEQAYPQMFDGVRDYLTRTSSSYEDRRPRTGREWRLPELHAVVGYHA